MDGGGGSLDAAAGHTGTDSGKPSSGPTYDGTTGVPCTTSADCKGAQGPGVNVCTNTLTYTANSMIVNPLPTPVCMLPPGSAGAGNCDPAPASDPTAQLPHFCDGPDSPTSPGICIAGSATSPHVGTCSPMCTFRLDGSAPVGCSGKDTCVETGFVALDSAGTLLGWGSCFGTCEKDTDCAALGSGYTCQTDSGFCTANPVTRAKQLGQACTSSDTPSGACNCLTGNATSGYCSSACVYGGAPCPDGWTCDTLQSATVVIGGTSHSVPAENVGMSGVCVAPCTAPDGGAASCPGTSACKGGTPLGEHCLP